MAESARELVRKLGTFLADLTQDRPADRIHAEILDRLRDDRLPLDHRLAGVYLQDKDFVPIWTAIRNGASLPASSWETVVLPTVVFYSTEQAVKANLESAIGLWRAARDAVSAPLEIESAEPAEAAPLVPPPLLSEEDPEPEMIPWESDEPRTAGSSRPRRLRLWVPSAAGLTLVAVAALVLANFPEPASTPNTLPSTHVFPDPPTPPPSSSAEPEPSATPSGEPATPAPTTPMPSSTMRTVAPSAPRSLASTGKTRNSVSLTWQAPTEPGTGGIDRYRVFVNGQEKASPTGTAVTISGLAPATSYTFTVKAYSRMGKESPASSPLAVTTDRPSLNAPTPVPFEADIPISGDGWPCTTIEIYLDTSVVARPKTTAGHFTDVIPVEPDGWVQDLNTTDFFQLAPGTTWTLRATCAGVTQTTPISVGPKSVDPSP